MDKGNKDNLEDSLEEVLEEIFLEIYNNIEMLRENKNFRAWIYKTAIKIGKRRSKRNNMKAVLVDDNIEFGLLFRKKIAKLAEVHKIALEMTVLNDVDDPILWEASFDLYFVDIEMPKMSGFELIKKLKKSNIGAEYICISAQESYMYDAFFVRPMAFIRKDKLEEDIIRALRHLKEKQLETEEVVALKDGKGSVEVKPSEIIYCKGQGHYVELHCVEDKKLIRAKMQVIYEMLIQYEFVQAHKSYLVNRSYIERVKGMEIVMKNGMFIPISRRMKEKTMEVISGWLSEK